MRINTRSPQPPSLFFSSPVDPSETVHQGRFAVPTPYYSPAGDDDHLAPAEDSYWVFHSDSHRWPSTGNKVASPLLADLPRQGDPDYPDYHAQSHIGHKSGAYRVNPPCPEWAVVGTCGEGHQFAKSLICNREWCKHCGGDGGPAHLRRIAAKLPKARQIGDMARFIFTVPPEIRDRYRDPNRLAAFGVSIKRMLQGAGYARGLRRFHFFGEDHPGSELQGDGTRPYHPHLEVIAEGGYLGKKQLKRIKISLGRILGITDPRRLNFYYRYLKRADPPGKKFHWLKYMLRPTFEDSAWDPEMAYRLIGFRNAVSWGVWHSKSPDGKNEDYLPPVWDLPSPDIVLSDVTNIQSGICPVDGTVISWGGTVGYHVVSDNPGWWANLGGGYYLANGMARDGP